MKTAWVRITMATLVCTCGHEQPTGNLPGDHEGKPEQTCTECGATWFTPCAADCDPVEPHQGSGTADTQLLRSIVEGLADGSTSVTVCRDTFPEGEGSGTAEPGVCKSHSDYSTDHNEPTPTPPGGPESPPEPASGHTNEGRRCDKPAGHHDEHGAWVDYGGEERREEWHDDAPPAHQESTERPFAVDADQRAELVATADRLETLAQKLADLHQESEPGEPVRCPHCKSTDIDNVGDGVQALCMGCGATLVAGPSGVWAMPKPDPSTPPEGSEPTYGTATLHGYPEPGEWEVGRG